MYIFCSSVPFSSGDPLLESTFNDFASIIDDTKERYAAVKRDNSVAETGLSHAWLLLFGI
jgi:hypothetical protein